MRTEISPRWSPTWTRLRSRAERAWRSISRRVPHARWTLAAIALAVLVAAGYFFSASTEPAATCWLFEGQTLPRDQADRILAALYTAKIDASEGSKGRISVPLARKAEALALLTKQKLGPRNMDEMRWDLIHESSPWETQNQRDDRKEYLLSQELEYLIAGQPGIASAVVQISRSPGHAYGRNAAKMGAIVVIHRADEELIAPETIETIKAIFKAKVPDLPDDALTVLDNQGDRYLIAGNPAAAAQTMAHAREKELRGRIKEQLNWIDGLRVFVTLEMAATVPPPAPSPKAEVKVVVNQPVEVPEPPPHPVPPATSHPGAAKAQILVQVPISHYLTRFHQFNHHEPSRDELILYAARTEEIIRSTIGNIVPPGEFAGLKVDRIDDPAPDRPLAVTSEGESLRVRSWMLAAAMGMAIAGMMVLVAGARWMVGRRPAIASEASPRRAAFEVGDMAGPSERVRELVRLDPTAAAGVLQRWIGQGGHSS